MVVELKILLRTALWVEKVGERLPSSTLRELKYKKFLSMRPRGLIDYNRIFFLLKEQVTNLFDQVQSIELLYDENQMMMMMMNIKDRGNQSDCNLFPDPHPQQQ